MKHIYYVVGSAIAFILLVSIFAFGFAKDEFPDKHLEVVLRNIGHHILLQSNDSTSRVLPVSIVKDNVYQISFENSFGFTPDTLMRLVYEQLAKTDMPKDYIVRVKDCMAFTTIFAYEINTSKGDLKPCGERKQTIGCYIIQIEFLAENPYHKAWMFIAFIPLALVGFYFNRRQNKPVMESLRLHGGEAILKSSTDDPEISGGDYKQLGKFKYYDQKGALVIDDVIIDLSEKENKALSLFCSNHNMVVERMWLKKVLWEDEGVFVIDRNVDVLVSKLRKKLSNDSSVEIVKVHGKGYKFRINNIE